MWFVRFAGLQHYADQKNILALPSSEGKILVFSACSQDNIFMMA